MQEYYAGGDFQQYLDRYARHKGFSLDQTIFYASEVLSALRAIHDMGIVYRDLKPENCLINSDGHLSLTDFGTALMTAGKTPITQLAGTIAYMAPEMLADEPYYNEVDMWSFGVFLFEMLVGRRPYYSENEQFLIKQIQTRSPRMSSDAARKSEHAEPLVMSLLTRHVPSRLTAADCMEHPFWISPDGSPLDWDAVQASRYPAPIDPIVADVTGELTSEELMREHDELEVFDSGAVDASPTSGFTGFDFKHQSPQR